MSRQAVLEKILGKDHPETKKARRQKVPKGDYLIELPVEFMEHCTLYMLNQTLDNLKADRRKRAAGRGTAVFSQDKAADLAELDRYIAAVQLVIDYHSPI